MILSEFFFFFLSDFGLSSHDETNTAEMIDQMFEEVLEYAGKVEKERREDAEDCDSGIVPCSDSQVKTEEKNNEVVQTTEVNDPNEDELLSFPPAGILSPLSKSVEAVVTPLVRTTDLCQVLHIQSISDVRKSM